MGAPSGLSGHVCGDDGMLVCAAKGAQEDRVDSDTVDARYSARHATAEVNARTNRAPSVTSCSY
jgi:hypothetical protein